MCGGFCLNVRGALSECAGVSVFRHCCCSLFSPWLEGVPAAREAESAKTVTLTLAAVESARVRYSQASDEASISRLDIAVGGSVIPATQPNPSYSQEVQKRIAIRHLRSSPAGLTSRLV